MIVRLYSGPDGESHFEDIQVSYEKQGMSDRAPAIPNQGMIFRQQEAGSYIDFHNAPRRQYLITLSGYVKVGLGNGEVRTFGPGDVMLAEDLTGRGHTTRVIGTEPRISIVIPI